MRILIQRVKRASVDIDQKTLARISRGLLIFLGIEESDGQADIDWLCNKICKLRIFNDQAGVMNLSVMDVDGEMLVISQFTLHASTKKGNRPSYIRAAKPETAFPLYEGFIQRLEQETGRKIRTGKFGAMMNISLINDGPVTLIMDSKSRE